MGPTTRAVGGAALLALVAGALFFQDLGRYPLLDPDEARHAEVAREMAAGHGLRRLFLPTLDLEPYREKPAGYYWLGRTRLWRPRRRRGGGAPGERARGAGRCPRALCLRAAPLGGPGGARAGACGGGLGSESPHAGPIHYYLLWLPALLLPWTLFVPGPLRRAARDPARRPLLLWAVFVPAVLTLARGKLATYALSALAPLALIVGTELASEPAAKERTTLRLGGALAALVLLAGAGAALFAAPGHLTLSVRVLLAGAGLGWA